MKSARSENVPILSSILREKALQIAAELGKSNFNASSKLLQRFILWHDLILKKVCSEAADVNDKELKEWRESKLSDGLK